MSAKRYEDLITQDYSWNLPKGAKYHRLTHNEMCLGFHWCYIIRNHSYGRHLVGPGIKGYDPKCDCDPYEPGCPDWNPKVKEPYLIVKTAGVRPKDPK